MNRIIRNCAFMAVLLFLGLTFQVQAQDIYLWNDSMLYQNESPWQLAGWGNVTASYDVQFYYDTTVVVRLQDSTPFHFLDTESGSYSAQVSANVDPGAAYFIISELYVNVFYRGYCPDDEYYDIFGFWWYDGQSYEDWWFDFTLRGPDICVSEESTDVGDLIAEVDTPPRVTLTAADLCSDSISTSLYPPGDSGTFILQLTGSGGSYTLVNQTRTGGSYSDSFSVANMPTQTYTSIQATWNVTGLPPGSTSGPYSITVLGNYTTTCYYTARESDYSGDSVNVGTSTSSCTWSSRNFLSAFLDRVLYQGSGIDSSGAGVQPEGYCTNPPQTSPPYNGWRFRDPTTIKTSCIDNPTVDLTAANPVLGCETLVYVTGLGCRTIQDTGSGVGNTQLDIYKGVGASVCSGWSNQNRKTIKINN